MSGISFSVPAAVGGAAVGYVAASHSQLMWYSIGGAALGGLAVPMIVSAMSSSGVTVGRVQTDLLWGGLAAAASKLGGLKAEYQYGLGAVGVVAAEYSQGNL